MTSKYILIAVAVSLLTLISCMFIKKEISSNTQNTPTDSLKFYGFKMKTLEGQEINFSQFKGKKVLIVNTASECGYTPQYKDLQVLHDTYKGKVTIIGFPCNDFGGQEPGNADEIKTFCQKNYGVTFLMMEKISVKGKSKPALYEWLADKSQNGWCDKTPTWNFCKYLINEKGQLIHFFSSNVKPTDQELVDAILK